MKNWRGLLAGCLVLAVAGIALVSAQFSDAQQKVPAANAAAASVPFLSIHEINQRKPSSGIFETQGYVAKIYTCPVCPPDAICKPCMRDNIIISENNISLKTYNLSNKEMIIFTDKTKSLVKSKKYRFRIKIIDQKTTNAPLNDIELVTVK